MLGESVAAVLAPEMAYLLLVDLGIAVKAAFCQVRSAKTCLTSSKFVIIEP